MNKKTRRGRTSFGERLAKYRHLAGLTSPAKLAAALTESGYETKESRIIGLEYGRGPSVTLPELIKLAKILKVAPVALAVNLEDPFGSCGLDGLENVSNLELYGVLDEHALTRWISSADGVPAEQKASMWNFLDLYKLEVNVWRIRALPNVCANIALQAPTPDHLPRWIEDSEDVLIEQYADLRAEWRRKTRLAGTWQMKPSADLLIIPSEDELLEEMRSIIKQNLEESGSE